MTQSEKLICIRYPDNKCDRIPRSEAQVLVNNGQAVFTTKSRYHSYLNQEAKRIEDERRKGLRNTVRKKAITKKA